MNSELNKYAADALVADRLREAERFRGPEGASSVMPDSFEAVTVRLARAADAEAVVRLSELDGRRAPRGSILVAEVDGLVLVARSLENGASVADPFRPTAHLTELLELRSAHLRNAANGRAHHRRRGLLAWLRALGKGHRRARLQDE